MLFSVLFYLAIILRVEAIISLGYDDPFLYRILSRGLSYYGSAYV